MFAEFRLFGIVRSNLLLRLVLFPIFLLICVSAPWQLCAQNPNGALRGEVQDASGARGAGALVVAQAADSSMSRAATANGQGEFRIEGMLPGSYRVTVTAKGFAEATADVDVAVSVVRDILVTLKLEG